MWHLLLTPILTRRPFGLLTLNEWVVLRSIGRLLVPIDEDTPAGGQATTVPLSEQLGCDAEQVTGTKN